MSHEVDGARSVLMPEIDGEDKEGAVDIVKVDLLSRFGVAHNQSNARRRRDGTAVLSLATCLSLLYQEDGADG